MVLFCRNAGLQKMWFEWFIKKQDLQLSPEFITLQRSTGAILTEERFVSAECRSGEVETSAGPAPGLCTTLRRCSAMGGASTAAAFCAVSICHV